jgi:phosphate transport system ATP-binding protein
MDNTVPVATPTPAPAPAASTPAISVQGLSRKPADRRLADEATGMDVRQLNLYYGEKRALHDISLMIPASTA